MNTRDEWTFDSADDVQDALRASLERPFEDALSMPPRAYTSGGFHALEVERIFRREWHCVGREDELDEHGKFVTLEIADEPVFAIRDKESIRAFANICRHRLARILEGRGQAGRLVCPYHAWTYGTDGQLLSAPYKRDGFDPSTCALPQLRVEIWRGWVYVTLNPDAAPLAPRLEALDGEMANYRMENYRTLFVADEIWDTNWKCLVENFSEAYHVFATHSKTVEPALPTRLNRYTPGGDAWFRFIQGRIGGVGYEYEETPPVLNDRLTEEERLAIPIFGIYPAHLVSLSPDRMFWLALQPRGAARVRVRWGLSVYPGAVKDEERDEQIIKLKAAFDAINAEDRGIIESVYRNAGANLAASGRLQDMELCVWEFGRYIARMTCGVK